MSNNSIDSLQNVLATEVFHYAKDAKKAAGRALGTIVEIVSYHLLKAWGFGTSIAIERRIPEFARSELTHNVEFTLHPLLDIKNITLDDNDLPFTAKKIFNQCKFKERYRVNIKRTQLLSTDRLLRNSCIIYENTEHLAVAHLGENVGNHWTISIARAHCHPYAMFECKRVGVEEGIKKGPQTIEKAKQGAYVAGAVSSLQKLKLSDGTVYGAIHLENDKLILEPYDEFMEVIINSNDVQLLRHFVMTVGVVSNHGNWFTSGDHNKELKVLSGSYDWLLFLSDIGLVEFVERLLMKPKRQFKPVQDAFISSYTGTRSRNRFTKVQMSIAANYAIQNYFKENIDTIEGWFNVISPREGRVSELKTTLNTLKTKNWQDILK